MDSKYFINIEKISSITFNKERKNDNYNWYDEQTTKSWYGSKTTTPAGWRYKKNSSINTTEQLKNVDEYKVDDINKVLYDKAKIDIYLKDQIIYEYFDTDADALKFIDDLITKSGKPFQVLENE